MEVAVSEMNREPFWSDSADYCWVTLDDDDDATVREYRGLVLPEGMRVQLLLVTETDEYGDYCRAADGAPARLAGKGCGRGGFPVSSPEEAVSAARALTEASVIVKRTGKPSKASKKTRV